MPRRISSALVAAVVGTALAVGATAGAGSAAAAPKVSPDTQAPTLAAFTIVPSTVSVTYTDANPMIDLRIKDGSGSDGPATGFDHGTVTLSTGSASLVPVDLDAGNLVGGTVTDGTYDVQVNVPQDTPVGSYTATISLTDVRGNTTTVTNSAAPLTVVATTDSAAPTMPDAVTASPATADVSRGDRDVTYGVHLLDPASGVASAGITVRSPAGRTETVTLFQSSGTAQDGRWTGRRTYGVTDTTGTWTVTALVARDRAGNTLNVTSGLGAPATVTRTADTTAPVLAAVNPTPASVTTTASSATVSVDIHASDNLSGVTYGQVAFTSPGGSQTARGYFSGRPDRGTSADGYWRAKITLPARATAGTWTLTSAHLLDAQGNGRDYSAAAPPPAAAITVTTAADTSAPTISGLSVGPSVVPSPDGSATIIGRFSVSDPVSGFAGASISFKGPDGKVDPANTTTLTDPSQYTLTGTAQSGTVSFAAYLPSAAKGTWTVASVTVSDLEGNARTYTGTTLTGALTVTVAAAAADTTAPRLTSLSFAVTAAADGSRNVTATLGATDGGNAASGLYSASVVLSPPDGGPSLYFTFDGTRPATGDYETGTFTHTENLPRFSTPGTWRVTGVSLWDANWNDGEYTQDTVATALGGTAPTVTVPADQDSAAPTLTSITTDAGAVDVTGGDPVVYHLAATDEAGGSGLASATVTLAGPDGRSVTGTANTSTWSGGGTPDVYVTVPQYASSGTWSMSGVTLTDRSGNVRRYTAGDLAALPGTHDLTVTALDDSVAPTVDGLLLTPRSVDTTAGGVATDLLVHLADASAGVGTASATLTSADGAQHVGSGLTLITGTVYDGWWQATVNVAKYARTGTWTVSSLTATDAAGNRVTQDASTLGSAATLAVTGAADADGPTLAGLDLSPATVDLAAGAQTVAVTATGTDAQSGVDGLLVTVTDPDGTPHDIDLRRTDAGAAGTATLAGTLPVAASAPTGTWTVATATLTDRYGNRSDYPTDALSGMHTTFATTRSAESDSPPASSPAPSPSDPSSPSTSPADPSSSPSDPGTTPPASTSPTTPPATTPPATTPPASVPSVGTTLVTGTVATTATYGATVPVSGKLTRSDTGATLVGRSVYLQWRGATSTAAFHTVTTPAKTNSYGWAAFPAFKPAYGVQVRLWAPASTGHLAAVSAVRTVAVKRHISAYSVTSAHRGHRFTIHGWVTPLPYGRPLYLQRWTGSYWRTLAAPALRHNAYTFTSYMWTRGTYTYRVVTTTWGGVSWTSSAYRKIRIY